MLEGRTKMNIWYTKMGKAKNQKYTLQDGAIEDKSRE